MEALDTNHNVSEEQESLQIDQEQRNLIQNSRLRRIFIALTWLGSFRNWLLIIYLLTWGFLIIFCSDPLDGFFIIQLLSKIVGLFFVLNFIQQEYANARVAPITKICCLACGMSILFFFNAGVYVECFYFFKKSPMMEKILHELLFEEATSIDSSNRRPMQALYIGNGYAKRLGKAMSSHFNRYGHNETKPFGYIENLNLIGNFFDDSGADAIIDALDHPFSYTDSLLLGRNEQIGDKTANSLAKLIKSSKCDSKLGKLLTTLEVGGTDIKEKGIAELYDAMGSRYFDYFGLEYLGKSSVTRSLEQVHKAKYLRSLSLAGNHLSDRQMSILSQEILKTNVTVLNLFNNEIDPKGVEYLIPVVKHLKEINLGRNKRIGDKGAAILATALKDPNITLQILFLNDCHVSQDAADALLSIFPGVYL